MTWQGVRAWAIVMRVDLEPWEAEVIVTLGNLRVNLHAEWRNEQIRQQK